MSGEALSRSSTASVSRDVRGPRRRAALLGAAFAEWTKLWTVRSTWACLLAAAGSVALMAVIYGVGSHGAHDPAAMETSATSVSATGVVFMGQFATIALATLVMAGEYSTTSIRTTLQCVPVRARMLLAKDVVLAPVCLLAGIVVAALGVLVAQIAIGSRAEPVQAGAVIGLLLKSGGYLGLSAAFVVGLGAIVRSVAGTLTIAILLLAILPMMLGSVSVHAVSALAPYLPGGAGGVLLGTADAPSYGTAGAVAVLAAWTIAANVAATAVLRRRDA